MTLVIIMGPHAVGKMTVGQELEKITGLKLFHNHMTIELVRNFFNVNSSPEGGRLNSLFRQEIFEAVAKSDLKGLIYTHMFDFDSQADFNAINRLIALYQSYNAKIGIVELCADYDVRIERNKTENRLLNKPSKRNLAHSEAIFRELEAKHRLNSHENEVPFENYLKIDNTNISPDSVAMRIKKHFAL